MKQLSVIADPFSLQFASLFRGSPRFCREMVWVYTSRQRDFDGLLWFHGGDVVSMKMLGGFALITVTDLHVWAIDDRGLPILIGRVMVPYRDMFGDSP